jgi:CheY-like chemotaxis protein
MMKPPAPRSLRILIVENHSDTRRFLAMYLKGAGHFVTTAATMQEGLKTATDSDCEVLISDIGLPDGDGWELLRRARLSHPVYAIAMSGYGMDKDREKSHAVGYRDHLLKPVDVARLNALLAEASAELLAQPPTGGNNSLSP